MCLDKFHAYISWKGAFREAVINAIVHNDYVRGGSPLLRFMMTASISFRIKFTKATQLVLECLQRKSDITIDAMVEEIGGARETIKRALKTLREKGFIRRIGSDKTGYYEVLKR